MTQHPWENMSPQDIDKILPSAMRENNADYFLHELYRTARDIDIYGWRDALTLDALVRFGPATSFAPGMPYHYRFYKFERNYYCYQIFQKLSYFVNYLNIHYWKKILH